ncbi:unnamed protein product [Tetraodon nigroviridis]|uniref:(spotted green pufferfish) hypothetical protein n=1 Tax=Tetraodon nigroviridis TaxID=99883 RepID=Q4RF35_TETNG|nr:unnamed protein product [Tetraodon nigroviridis]
MSSESHQAMGDGEWMARLRSYATTGVWPSGGNRPAPRQRKQMAHADPWTDHSLWTVCGQCVCVTAAEELDNEARVASIQRWCTNS